MVKTNLPLGVKALKKQYEAGTLSFDNPIQRSNGQWNLLSKSLLVHSILENFPIPPVYFLKSKDENDVTRLDSLDGKQRLTNLFDFIDGGYSLASSCPSVEFDGEVVEIANKSFEELSDDMKDEILGYRFTCYSLEDITEEEVEEVFSRLNNSVPLSPIQKCRSIMGYELASWTRTLTESDFLQHVCSFSLAQSRRESPLEVLLQGMLIIDARNEGYDYKSISAAEVTRYCKYIRNNYSEDKRNDIEMLMGYLNEAFGTERCKYLKKSHVPMVIVLAYCSIEADVSAEDFKSFIEEFFSYENEEYSINMGQGNIKKSKTQGRLKAIADDFQERFNIADIDILGESEEVVTDEEPED